jgi:tRNA nucleotidyltransferase/poly(A) polymerase
MIIVKTTTGTHFVNEKLMKRVWHDKENFKVWITQLDGSVDSILHVAQVTFVSDAQPMEYNDDGSIIEAMKFKLKEMEAECNAKIEKAKNELEKHRECMKNSRDDYFKSLEEIDILKRVNEALKSENDEHKNEVMKLHAKLRDYGCEL